MFRQFPLAGNVQHTHTVPSVRTHKMKGDLPTHVMINKTNPKCKPLLDNKVHACTCTRTSMSIPYVLLFPCFPIHVAQIKPSVCIKCVYVQGWVDQQFQELTVYQTLICITLRECSVCVTLPCSKLSTISIRSEWHVYVYMSACALNLLLY